MVLPALYLESEECLLLHEEAMKRSGMHPTALRFEDKLNNALYRPRYVAYYNGVDLIVQAATLIVAISEAQAFQDGNKRTAMLAGLVFLELNGLKYFGDSDMLAVLIAEAASPLDQDAAIHDLAEWLRPHINLRP